MSDPFSSPQPKASTAMPPDGLPRNDALPLQSENALEENVVMASCIETDTGDPVLPNDDLPPVRIVQATLVIEEETQKSPALVASQAETLVCAELAEAAPRQGWIRRTVVYSASVIEWFFGLLSLFLGLAVLATIPIIQFVTLGYLLEVSGRITRGGRLRDGFFGIRRAARIGSFVFGAWLWLLPLRLVSDLWYSAEMIAPGSAVSRGWRLGLIVLTVLIVGHICWAWLQGGRFRHFLWPAPLKFLRSLPRIGQVLSNASDATWDFVTSMQIPYFFWLGVRGFAGAVTWLFVPVCLLAVAHDIPGDGGGGALVGALGGLLFAAVLLYLPFLQAHFAAENRFTAIFEIGEVRRMFCRAPIAFWFALLVTLLLALPLYLLKIELPPSETTWIPSLFFVLFIFPARMLTGWSLSRAKKREAPRHVVFRWLSRLAEIPVVTVYAFIVYFTMYFTWYGAWSLFEQHPFLVPTPFLGG